jgi:hypothetical protein
VKVHFKTVKKMNGKVIGRQDSARNGFELFYIDKLSVTANLKKNIVLHVNIYFYVKQEVFFDI